MFVARKHFCLSEVLLRQNSRFVLVAGFAAVFCWTSANVQVNERQAFTAGIFPFDLQN
jgi:hypothetical protein